MTSRPRAEGPPLQIRPRGPGDPHAVRAQLLLQDGVVTRSQLEALGLTYADLQRMLRRRELVRIAPGVFVDHTGPLSWVQRAWAGVLHAWPAALSHETGWRQTPVIHLAVAPGRKLTALPGTELHRITGFEDRVEWRSAPPHVRVEHAALDAAAAAPSERAAVALLTGAVQERRTTYAQLESALAGRARLRRGRWLRSVLVDLANGTNSALEHAYLVRVERPHGLPAATRQLVSRMGVRKVERDVAYEDYGVYVELDGRAFHDDPVARDRDLDRDLEAAVVARAVTVRLGWGQVLDRPCRTAGRIGVLLRRNGWTGSPVACPRCPRSA